MRISRLTAAMLLLAVSLASGRQATAAPLPGAVASLRDTAEWLLEEHAGRGGILPNGARRGVVLRQRRAGATVAADYSRWGLNNTAACKSLEFLSLYARHVASTTPAGENSERHRVRLGIRRLVGLILSLRSNDPSRIHYGAIQGGQPSGIYGANPNAHCGRALLLAGRVMDEPAWRDVAIDIAGFLLRLQNPDPHYVGRYGAGFAKRMMRDGIFDHVYGNERIETNMSTWNLVAAPFLDDIYAETGNIAYRYAAIRIVRGLAYGALNGYDYFAVGGLHNGRWVKTAKSFVQIARAPADNRWHRQGEARPAAGGTVTAGTDGAEYGLQALHEFGYDRRALLRAYIRLRDMPNQAAGVRLDMGISFSGYFRMACDPGGACTNYHYGTYYDSVGAGILARFKQDLGRDDVTVANDAARTAATLLLGRALGTMTEGDFTPRWSAGFPRERTDGVLPVATNATALLRLVFPDAE